MVAAHLQTRSLGASDAPAPEAPGLVTATTGAAGPDARPGPNARAGPGSGRRAGDPGAGPAPTYVKGPLHTGRGGGRFGRRRQGSRTTPPRGVSAAPHGGGQNRLKLCEIPHSERSFETPIFRLPLPPAEGADCGPRTRPVGRRPWGTREAPGSRPAGPVGAHVGPRRRRRQAPARRRLPGRSVALRAGSDSSGFSPGSC
jgi:hypothetical protein